MKIFTYIKNNSSRVNKKNFQKIDGLELWKILLYELNEIGCEVFIDTDSQEVIDECSKDRSLQNTTAYFRKKKFIDMENDSTNTLSPANLMFENFLDNYVSDNNETIVLTHVTSPFLKKETVLNAVKIHKTGKYDYIHSVNIERDFGFLGGFDNPINFNPNVIQRTQDLTPIYFSNGAFFIMNKRVFKENQNRWGKNIHFYPLSPVEGVEIDYYEDLEIAKIIKRGLRNEKN